MITKQHTKCGGTFISVEADAASISVGKFQNQLKPKKNFLFFEQKPTIMMSVILNGACIGLVQKCRASSKHFQGIYKYLIKKKIDKCA